MGAWTRRNFLLTSVLRLWQPTLFLTGFTRSQLAQAQPEG
jgi:hypothetical protein